MEGRACGSPPALGVLYEGRTEEEEGWGRSGHEHCHIITDSAGGTQGNIVQPLFTPPSLAPPPPDPPLLVKRQSSTPWFNVSTLT